jgi:hypothetical protein
MIEYQRRPIITGMAIVTLELRLEVAIVLTGCRRAVMTTGAGPWRYIVVIETGRNPSGRRMTGVALCRRHQMAGLLTQRRRSVMTTGTVTDDLGMVDLSHRRKVNNGVAILADIAGLNVLCRLTDRVGRVMAAEAITGDVVMIKIGR